MAPKQLESHEDKAKQQIEPHSMYRRRSLFQGLLAEYAHRGILKDYSRFLFSQKQYIDQLMQWTPLHHHHHGYGVKKQRLNHLGTVLTHPDVIFNWIRQQICSTAAMGATITDEGQSRCSVSSSEALQELERFVQLEFNVMMDTTASFFNPISGMVSREIWAFLMIRKIRKLRDFESSPQTLFPSS